MAAADIIHDAVKNALIKDGWTITHDPYVIKYEEVTLYADLGAERAIAAELAGTKIVVEIKMQRYQLPLIIVNVEKEEIVKWTKPLNIVS